MLQNFPLLITLICSLLSDQGRRQFNVIADFLSLIKELPEMHSAPFDSFRRGYLLKFSLLHMQHYMHVYYICGDVSPLIVGE